MSTILAGKPEADAYVLRELEAAGLTPEKVAPYGETKTSYQARIGGFSITRSWCYWSANAPIYHGLRYEAAVRLNTTPCDLPHSYYSGGEYTLGSLIRVEG